jgi:hypothetical protein
MLTINSIYRLLQNYECKKKTAAAEMLGWGTLSHAAAGSEHHACPLFSEREHMTG